MATKEYSEASQDANRDANFTEFVSDCESELPQESPALSVSVTLLPRCLSNPIMCACMIVLHCEQCHLQRNVAGCELLHRTEATDYFHPNREYALKEPSVDAEEELTEASQWPSNGRQWSLADDQQAISSLCKSEFLMVI